MHSLWRFVHGRLSGGGGGGVVVQSLSHVWLCDPMDCSTPGSPVHHLPELAQTHVNRVSDAIKPSRPLSSPSPPSCNLSQHQGLFQWVHQVAKVLELQLQHQSFQWIFRAGFPLGLTGLISLLSKELSRLFSSTTVQKHHFFMIQLSLLYGPILTPVHDYWKKP